jgi:hypothetical protein
MYTSKIALLFVLFIMPIINYGQYTDQINSNRPGESMSAYSVGKSLFQVESGVFGIAENHPIVNYNAYGFGIDLMLRYGLFLEQLELVADFQYQYQYLTPALSNPAKSALKQTVVGAKYLIYDPYKNYEKKIDLLSWKKNQAFDWHQLIPAVSVFAGANMTLASNPYYFSTDAALTPKIMLITQNHLGDGSWAFVTNIIADYIGTDYPSYGYVMTLTKGFNHTWSGFIENQGYNSSFYSDALIRGGGTFLVHDDLQIDVSISKSFKTTPSILYCGIGLSWRYDANHQAVLLQKDKGDKRNAKSKKNKKQKL